MEINKNMFWRNKSKICRFDEKENDKKYIKKWWENCYFDCTSESETKTGIVLSTSQSERNRLRIWHDGQGLSIIRLRMKIQEQRFFLNSSMENFDSVSYRYDWTVTDVMSREHKIVIIPNLRRITLFGDNRE